MNRFVADNSIIAAWGLNEGGSQAQAVLNLVPDSELVVPSVWPLEFANVLVIATRKGRLSPADMVRRRDLILELPITVVPDDPGRVLTEVLALARDQRLSSYDASYLDLAMRERIPLATLDKALRDAAGRCGVELLPSGLTTSSP